MIERRHNPAESYRNHKRVLFIRSLYATWADIHDMVREYQHQQTLDYERIDNMMENRLRILRDVSNDLYRIPEELHLEHKRQRMFDRIFAEMWHEMDKVRGNIRLLEAYHQDVGRFHESSDKVLDAIHRLDTQVLNTASKEMPRLLNRIRRIMDKIIPLFEQILALYHDNDVILRTVYFDRKNLEKYVGKPVQDYFFPLLHGSTGQGYVELVRSLCESGHTPEAKRVIKELSKRAESTPRLKPFHAECKRLLEDEK